MAKPRLFIGSSVAGLPIANAIKEELGQQFDVRVWDKDVFKLTYSNLENLMKALDETDFASLIFLPEDKLNIKGKETETVRDNVIFELGLFLGRLGRDKVSFAVPKDYNFHLLTDLAGITSGEFEYSENDRKVDVKSYSNKIKLQLDNLNIKFPNKGRFGDNILFNNTYVIYGNRISCKALVPQSKILIIEFQKIDAEFGFNVAAMGDWFIDTELNHDKTTFAKIIGPSESDMCLNIQKGGSVIIKAYDNDTSNLLFTKTVTISI